MIRGIDISHHNQWQIFPKKGEPAINFDKHDFIIMKATEGRTYVDPCMKKYVEMLPENKLHGFYHFARPENNSAEVEAKHFCDTLGELGEDAILVLDWEAKATSCPIQWAVDWCNYVERIYGKKPLIYCSSWYTKKLKPLLDNNNGLWVAHYTKNKKPTVHTYPTWAMWQYSSDPYDKNVFNGSSNQFRKYAQRTHR